MKLKQWLSLILSLLMLLPFSVKAETLASQTAVQEPQIVAESAILMDAKTKTVLYEKNAHETHYPASITKLMTALLAIENLDPKDTITFSEDAIYGIEPNSNHIGMQVGEQITVDEALHGLLLMSANEVANGLAEAVSGSIDAFANRMTDRAKELGALNTHFTNPHGLHNDKHYTTAYDMALIGSYLAENNYFLSIMKDVKYTIPPTNKNEKPVYLAQQHHMINKARYPKTYRADVIGGKTGYTDQARHTLVTIANQGDTTLVAVILNSEKANIYADTSALLDYGFSAYQSLTLHTTEDILKTLPGYTIKSGHAYQFANYGLALSEDAKAIVLNSVNPEDINLSFDLPEFIDATKQVGDSVGKVSFILNGQTIAQGDLQVKQIDLLPEPTFHFAQNVLMSPMILIIIGVASLMLLLLIFLLIRKYFIRKKQTQINKYFK